MAGSAQQSIIKLYFGKDGDNSWVRNKLKRQLVNYKHYNIL